jgi:ABC-type branched-subunit amino acid transport system substrate-binding protein
MTMRPGRSVRRLVAPAAVLLLAAGAGALAECRARAREVVIGYAFPQQGAPSVVVARAVLAARASRAGGPAVRIVYDSLSLADPAAVEVDRAHRFLALPRLVAVVGHGGSRGSLAAAPVYNEAHVVQLVPAATSRLLRRAGPWTLTLAPDDSVEGAFIGRFVAERLAARRITVFYVTDEYGAGLRDGVVAECARRGLAVVDQVPFGGRSDLGVLVDASLRQARPDVIVVAGRQRETGVIAREAQARLPGMRVVAGDGALNLPDLADSAGAAIDSVYVAAFWLPDDTARRSREFVAEFRRLTGVEPSPAQALTHDALMLAATAAGAAGADRGAIRRWLLDLGVGRPPYAGVTGPISFAPGRPARLLMARVRGGRAVRVAP